MPRCGRSQERSKDQVPSMVLTWISQKPSPSSSRAYSPRGWQAGIDVVLVGVDASALDDGGLDDRLDGRLLHIGQHVEDHLATTLDQAENGWLLLRQRAAARRARQSAAAPEPPL